MASWCELPDDVDARPGGADADMPGRVSADMDEFWNFTPEEAQS